MMHGVIAGRIMVVVLMATRRHVPVAQHNNESAFDRSQHEPCRDERPQQ